jgi:hypothetical protein
MTAPTEVHEGGQALARPREPVSMLAFDPFQVMDRLDEEALNAELEGRVAEELVYVVKDGGQEVVGLSKAGVDECCMALVTQGQVIREEDLSYTLEGEGEDREAMFKVVAARYGVSPTGVEVRLDQVIGVKRQPLYYEPAQELTLDSPCPGKKYKGKTFRQVMDTDEGRDYLNWMAANFRDEATRTFVARLLDGEDVRVQPGRQKNPHWYEHGAMKAARNARFRLIPGKVRAAVIAMARQGGQVREASVQPGEQPAQQPARAERRSAERPAQDPLTEAASYVLPGKAESWGGYAGKALRDVPQQILSVVVDWANERGEEAKRNNRTEKAALHFKLAMYADRVYEAQERGELSRPPHKDGTPREPGED